MRYARIIIASLCLSLLGTSYVYAKEPISKVIENAIASKSRPDSDTAQDPDRKPAKVLAFIGIKPGMRVADLIPGGGYYTRLFSKIVGRHGHVYSVVPTEFLSMRSTADAPIQAIAASPGYKNVTELKQSINKVHTPKKLDIAFTSMNYHDLHDPFMGPANMSEVNKSIFNSLKHGGVYIVLDHAAEAGSGVRDTNTLHRIDPAVVKKEVLAAGFVFDGESNALRNPDDDHTKRVFDPSIRGRTDKFIYKFRKP